MNLREQHYVVEGAAACVECDWWTDTRPMAEAIRHHDETGHAVVAEQRIVLGEVAADAELPALLYPPKENPA